MPTALVLVLRVCVTDRRDLVSRRSVVCVALRRPDTSGCDVLGDTPPRRMCVCESTQSLYSENVTHGETQEWRVSAAHVFLG